MDDAYRTPHKISYRTFLLPSQAPHVAAMTVEEAIRENIRPGEHVVSVYPVNVYQSPHQWITGTQLEILFCSV